MSQGLRNRPAGTSGGLDADPAAAAVPVRTARFDDPMGVVRAERDEAAAQISRTLKVWRKASGGGEVEAKGNEEKEAKEGADAAAGEATDKVSKPGEPAEKEADAVSDKVADDLHGGGDEKDGEKGDKKDAEKGDKKGDKKDGKDAKKGKKPGPEADEKAGSAGEKEEKKDDAEAGKEAAPKIGAKLEAGPRIFRKAGDPKNITELVAKLTGKALEAYNQLKELEVDAAINGICASAKVKQDDGTLNVAGAQAAFEAKWLDAPTFASKKLLKDNAFKKKIDDALSAIKNSCEAMSGALLKIRGGRGFDYATFSSRSSAS